MLRELPEMPVKQGSGIKKSDRVLAREKDRQNDPRQPVCTYLNS